jgi:hypothetical protein
MAGASLPGSSLALGLSSCPLRLAPLKLATGLAAPLALAGAALLACPLALLASLVEPSLPAPGASVSVSPGASPPAPSPPLPWRCDSLEAERAASWSSYTCLQALRRQKGVELSDAQLERVRAGAPLLRQLARSVSVNTCANPVPFQFQPQRNIWMRCSIELVHGSKDQSGYARSWAFLARSRQVAGRPASVRSAPRATTRRAWRLIR